MLIFAKTIVINLQAYFANQFYSKLSLLFDQTGSGKTFTITGGAEKYSDRGLIPRALSYVFEYIEKVNNNNNIYHNIFTICVINL